jgi:RHS repeat-associated protein
MTRITQADGTILGFTFDALGRHATRTSGALPTTIDTYGYLGTGDVVVSDVQNQAGITLSAAVDAAGDRLMTSTGAASAWLVPDLHGDVIGQTSAAGTLTDAFRYDAYGLAVGTTLAGSVPTPWRYQGRLLESTSGGRDLYDLTARSYAPDLGAFTSLDSVAGSAQNPVSLDRYLYAAANPETLVDPTGHASMYEGGGCGSNGTYCGGVTRSAGPAVNAASVARTGGTVARPRGQSTGLAWIRELNAGQARAKQAHNRLMDIHADTGLPVAGGSGAATDGYASGFMRMNSAFLTPNLIEATKHDNTFGAVMIGAAVALPVAAICLVLCSAAAAALIGGSSLAGAPAAERLVEDLEQDGGGGAAAAAAENGAATVADTAGATAGSVSLEPQLLRFSQSSVNGVNSISSNMRANGWVGDPIDAVQMPDGALTTIDNTRVLAAHQAGINVQAVIHGFSDLLPTNMIDRFTTTSGVAPSTWGDALANRIAGQSSGFRALYPNGAPFTGWDGG